MPIIMTVRNDQPAAEAYAVGSASYPDRVKSGCRMLRSRTWNLTGALVLFGFAATCGWFGLYHDPGAVDRPGDLIGWGAGAALCVAGAIRVLMVGVIATAE